MIEMIILIYLIVGLASMLIYCLGSLPFINAYDKSMIIRESFLIGMFWPVALIALIVTIWKFRR